MLTRLYHLDPLKPHIYIENSNLQGYEQLLLVLFVGERGGLLVESLNPEREVGSSIPTSTDTFAPGKVLVIPRKGGSAQHD